MLLLGQSVVEPNAVPLATALRQLMLSLFYLRPTLYEIIFKVRELNA